MCIKCDSRWGNTYQSCRLSPWDGADGRPRNGWRMLIQSNLACDSCQIKKRYVKLGNFQTFFFFFYCYKEIISTWWEDFANGEIHNDSGLPPEQDPSHFGVLVPFDHWHYEFVHYQQRRTEPFSEMIKWGKNYKVKKRNWLINLLCTTHWLRNHLDGRIWPKDKRRSYDEPNLVECSF